MSSLLNSDFDSVIAHAEVIVLGNADECFRALVQQVPEGKHVVDLVGFMAYSSDDSREGICW
ncbi:GDP-mannose 6-dehydrogenase [compost metagenome]